jgi:hypothetical protein
VERYARPSCRLNKRISSLHLGNYFQNNVFRIASYSNHAKKLILPRTLADGLVQEAIGHIIWQVWSSQGLPTCKILVHSDIERPSLSVGTIIPTLFL